MKLHKFNKNKSLTKLKLKQNRNKNIKVFSIILSVVILFIGIIYFTFARYETTQEYHLVNATVGDFSYDVSLVGYIYDNEKHNVPPSKDDDYIVSDVTCDNATGVWNNESWTFNLSNITGKVKCTISFEKIVYTKIAPSDLKRGDKVTLTLTGNEGTVSNWIVLNEGENPEIFPVSSLKYTLTRSESNYLNYVYILNNEARSYIDSKYIVSARSFGYNNQVEKCSNLSSCPNEDIYQADIDSMNLVGKNLYSLFVAGRTKSEAYNDYYGIIIDFFGTANKIWIYEAGRTENPDITGYNILPVLKLRSDIKIIRNEYTKDNVVQQ